MAAAHSGATVECMSHTTRVLFLTTTFVLTGIVGVLRGRPGLSVHEAATRRRTPRVGRTWRRLGALRNHGGGCCAGACLPGRGAVVGLDLRRSRAMTLLNEFYSLATADDLAAMFFTLGIEASPEPAGL